MAERVAEFVKLSKLLTDEDMLTIMARARVEQAIDPYPEKLDPVWEPLTAELKKRVAALSAPYNPCTGRVDP
jgi:hypothetical protein